MVDIVGGEKGLFDLVDLHGVRHVVVEFHAAVIEIDGVMKVFRRLSDLGFAYNPQFSSSHIVTLTPVEEFEAMWKQ